MKNLLTLSVLIALCGPCYADDYNPNTDISLYSDRRFLDFFGNNPSVYSIDELVHVADMAYGRFLINQDANEHSALKEITLSYSKDALKRCVSSDDNGQKVAALLSTLQKNRLFNDDAELISLCTELRSNIDTTDLDGEEIGSLYFL